MHISQADIGRLSDNSLPRMVIALLDAADTGQPASPVDDFYRLIAAALVVAKRERDRAVTMLDVLAQNAGGVGRLVGDDDAAVAAELDRLRRAAREESGPLAPFLHDDDDDAA